MSPSASYTTCMALAIATAVVLRRPSELPTRTRWGLWIGAIAGSALGAKLPFVLLAGEGLFGGAWLSDGKTILSGLAGGYLGVEAAKWLLGVREKTGDGWVVPLAAALAVGRWGCFFKG